MRNRGRARLLGLALVLYGLIGIGLFVVLALGVTRPLDRAQRLSASVEDQRAALVESLGEAETTIRQMSESVERMDASLAEAKAATDRAANISRGVAQSMYQLRDTVSLEVPFLGQPLAGLAPSFDQSGQNLDLLGQDVGAIGVALESNRADVTLTAQNMADLADSVRELTRTVRESPGVEISTTTIESVRLAVFAVAAWMVLFAVGCVVAGMYLLSRSRGPVVVVVD
jgi:hypothetical protein